MTIPKRLQKAIGTTKAKQQHAKRRSDQAKDEKKVLGAMKNEMERLEKGGTNFALFNMILSVTDFRECAPGTMEPMHILYERLMIHLNRVSKEAQIMADELGLEFVHPTDMAVEMLEEIAKRARARAKANKYAAKTGKPKLIVPT